jgi:hypothetical protein
VSAAAVLANAREAVDHDPMRVASESGESRAWRQFWRAVVLSPSLEVCEALVAGESVPLDRLDPEWSRRFGLIEERAA